MVEEDRLPPHRRTSLFPGAAGRPGAQGEPPGGEQPAEPLAESASPGTGPRPCGNPPVAHGQNRTRTAVILQGTRRRCRRMIPKVKRFTMIHSDTKGGAVDLWEDLLRAQDPDSGCSEATEGPDRTATARRCQRDPCPVVAFVAFVQPHSKHSIACRLLAC